MRWPRANACSSQLPAITVNGVSVPLRTSDFETAIADARRTRQPHNKARETFVSSMLSMVRTRVVEELDYTPEQAELNDIMAQLRMNDKLRVTLNLAWLPMDGRWLLDQLFSKPAQLRRFAPWLSDAQVSMLTRPKGAPHAVRHSTARRSARTAGSRPARTGAPGVARRAARRRGALRPGDARTGGHRVGHRLIEDARRPHAR